MIYMLIVTILSILFVFHVSTRYNRRGRILKNIPGPTAYPLFGSTLKFNFSCPNKFWEAARKNMKEFYPISKLWLCTTGFINVQHPDDLEVIFNSQKVITKGYMYTYLHPWLKMGLLTSSGEKWRHRRKILTPAFHFSILKRYMEITDEEGQKFISDLRSDAKETVRELMPFCLKYTLNIICEAAMGVSLSAMNKKDVEEYTEAVHDMGNIVIYRLPRPYIYDWMLPFIGCGARMRKTLKTLHTFTDKVIKERKEYHAKYNDKYLNEVADEMQGKNTEDSGIGKKKRMAMLDLLLVAQKNGLIDDEGIKEEVDTFTFEGHDTTGMAMAFTLLLLAENKDAQDGARAEVVELLDRNDGKINNTTTLQELNYLERCIKEAIRLYPPVATMMRYTAENFQLKNALVPADTDILIHVYDTHRDPNFWPEPEKFDPDRFLPENSKGRHPFAYVPFSAGSRNCIGQKFAMMELKSLIGKILYNFYLEPIDRSSDMKIIADIVIRPLDPVHIKLIRIDH